ncbi:M81 family metallopeptidase [Paracoccus sanguinis]|uniref:M81 family metallopeptidase n=1 Tax=Paracoccus sanguinis TaxID=1545044 RepID=UPI00051FE3A1|nr:M81 family metallopeptidase [Paracoccus sanguinis]KGJ15366.1 microcystin degradation protein MlrC [Paracoccus sanguinis]
MSRKRVAFAGFVHESNSFAPTPAGLDAFRHGGGYLPLSRGPALLAADRGLNLPISGALAHADAAGWQVVPVLYAGAVPSAPVTAEAYDRITAEIVDGIAAALPLDGVFLDLHGAMVAAHKEDGEGALLDRVRAVVGPGVPVVAALDLHGNISARMVAAADLLEGFRTYPHVDMNDTGRRAAAQLDRLMGGARDHKAFRQLDFLIPIAWQSTLGQPGGRLYDLAARPRAGVASLSLFMGFPAADIADCGPSVVAYGPDAAAVQAACDEVAAAVAAAEAEFAGEALAPDEAVRRAMALAQGAPRPVVIADTQDNPGAGGDSDTTGMLAALIACGAERAAIGLIVDAAAAAAAHAAGEGATLELTLGGRSGTPGDAPYAGRFTVERLSDGLCHATGPFYGGATLELGPSACLRAVEAPGVRVVLTSAKTQMADREMFRFVGIAPEDQPILVVKSSVHFRADFQPIAKALLTAVAPGPMPLSPASLPFTRLRPGLRLAPRPAAADAAAAPAVAPAAAAAPP